MTPEQYTRTYLPDARRVSAIEKLTSTVGKGSMGLIVGGATGAFLLASIGVSAHTGSLPFAQPTGVHQSHNGDQASVIGTELLRALEPAESPPAAPTPQAAPNPTAEPTQRPETEGSGYSGTSESGHSSGHGNGH
jgi:hypothetical protein